MDLAYPEFRKPRLGYSKRSWGFQHASSGFMYHCTELADPQDLRIAWALAVQREEGWLEVEELFVRPTFRRQGHGKGLLRSLEKLAVDLECRLKMWISHADTAASNIAVIDKLIKPIGLSIKASGQRWAPLLASPSGAAEIGQRARLPATRVHVLLSYLREGLAHAFTTPKARVPRPSRVLCERAGLFADIAAAAHGIHGQADPLRPRRCYGSTNHAMGQRHEGHNPRSLQHCGSRAWPLAPG